YVHNQDAQSGAEVKLVEIDEFRKGIVESLELEKAEIAKLLEERSVAEGFVWQLRLQQFEVVAREARYRNEIISRNELIQRLLSQIQRLEDEATGARDQ